jgi:hypothetical protein
MKTITIILIAVNLLITATEGHAGIAGFYSWFRGECDKPDENNVRFCSEKDTGKIYYVYEGIAFNSYPDIKKD